MNIINILAYLAITHTYNETFYTGHLLIILLHSDVIYMEVHIFNIEVMHLVYFIYFDA